MYDVNVIVRICALFFKKGFEKKKKKHDSCVTLMSFEVQLNK